VFDVAVIGGGINGACVYHHLCSRGFSVVLVDSGDFACGTSQTSAMMIWGGLLYLRSLDFATVRRLCTSRDRMLRDMGEWVNPRSFRYLPASGSRAAFSYAGLLLYWLLGGCRRAMPRREHTFEEQSFLARNGESPSVLYEEASLATSDARFVLHWILPHLNGVQTALNYCAVEGGGFDRQAREWRLQLNDTLMDKFGDVRAKCVINAAGAWTDHVNRRMDIETPFKHVLSKGVFIALRRKTDQRVPLIFDTLDGRDAMSLLPWGPISLWGPTETVVDTVEDGYTIQPGDVRFLLNELNEHLRDPSGPEDIISLRCGVRPLAVERASTKAINSIKLSRRHIIHRDSHVPWISIYGGKLTDCIRLANKVVRLLRQYVSPKSAPTRTREIPVPAVESFPEVPEPLPAADWCSEWEMCWTLDDYLRRRTNIAQWIDRGGLGSNDKNAPRLLELAKCFRDDDRDALQDVSDYRLKVGETHDRVLADC